MIDVSTSASRQEVAGMVTITATDGTVTVEWLVSVDWPKVGYQFIVEILPAAA
jgi:hypothetical protein